MYPFRHCYLPPSQRHKKRNYIRLWQIKNLSIFLPTGNQQQRLPSVRAPPNGGSAMLIVECHMKNIFTLLFQNIYTFKWMHYVFHPFKAIFALNHNFVSFDCVPGDQLCCAGPHTKSRVHISGQISRVWYWILLSTQTKPQNAFPYSSLL